MSLTAYEGGRALPSVFSDIPSRFAIADLEKKNQEKEEQLQKARRRFGALAMWFFVLSGITIVIAVIAFVVYGWFTEQKGQADTLRGENVTLVEASSEYQNFATLRNSIMDERRSLLDTLEGKGRTLNPEQLRRGWVAAGNTCFGPPEAERCFMVDTTVARAEQEASQTWPHALRETNRLLTGELDMLRRAEPRVRVAQASAAPQPPPRVCDRVTGICQRP